MTINNFAACYDFETSGINKYNCQPLQLACIIIDIRKLEIVPDSLFESLIRPVEDIDEQKKHGLGPITAKALEINKLDMNELRLAPQPKVVWKSYVEYLSNYNLKGIKGNAWTAPIAAGYNNSNYDDQITIRMCQKYGPKLDDNGSWTIHHPFHNFDAMKMAQNMFHNMKLNNTHSLSFDNLRKYFGYSTENAHNAKTDVMQTADLIIRFLKLFRKITGGYMQMMDEGKPVGKIKFQGCVNEKV